MRPLFVLFLCVSLLAGADRINHEGRILGPLPVVTMPVLFNTPQADAIVSAMQIMPVNNPWNEDVSQYPLLSNSDAMIAQIISDLAANRRTLRAFSEMNYVLVPDNQATASIKFFNYPDESDLNGGVSPDGLYPIPANLPIETWPVGTGSLTLSQWQQDTTHLGGDRHSISVQPGAQLSWETWETKLVGAAWQASNGARFNLASNSLRPAGWTSGDAAGLPMFPAVVRYDECQRGMVEHALRLVVKQSRLGPIYPATHQASSGNTSDPNIPAMGQRLRLKSGFTIPAGWTIQEKAVLLALKKHGAIVADNGGFFSVSVCPDDRYPSGCFDHLSTITIDNFEVVQTTGATGGPRSPGAPTASAGPDQWIPIGGTAQLAGSITASSSVTTQWTRYSGPAAVAFGDATNLATTASFTVPGVYTLMLSATDGVHAVAYDAVTITVVLNPGVSRSVNDMIVSFPTTSGHHYRVDQSGDLTAWTPLADQLAGTGAVLNVTHSGAGALARQFYRIVLLD